MKNGHHILPAKVQCQDAWIHILRQWKGYVQKLDCSKQILLCLYNLQHTFNGSAELQPMGNLFLTAGHKPRKMGSVGSHSNEIVKHEPLNQYTVAKCAIKMLQSLMEELPDTILLGRWPSQQEKVYFIHANDV